MYDGTLDHSDGSDSIHTKAELQNEQLDNDVYSQLLDVLKRPNPSFSVFNKTESVESVSLVDESNNEEHFEHIPLYMSKFVKQHDGTPQNTESIVYSPNYINASKCKELTVHKSSVFLFDRENNDDATTGFNIQNYDPLSNQIENSQTYLSNSQHDTETSFTNLLLKPLIDNRSVFLEKSDANQILASSTSAKPCCIAARPSYNFLSDTVFNSTPGRKDYTNHSIFSSEQPVQYNRVSKCLKSFIGAFSNFFCRDHQHQRESTSHFFSENKLNSSNLFYNSSPFAKQTPLPLTNYKQRLFLIFLFQNGVQRSHYVHSTELLKLILCYNAENSYQDKPGSVKLRDLRQICYQNLGSQRASIELRRNCILFNLLLVRCIVLHKKIILLPKCDKPLVNISVHNAQEKQNKEDEQLQNFVEKLRNVSKVQEQFELAVMETLFSEVCLYLTEEVILIGAEAEQLVFNGIGQLSTAVHFKKMSDLKRRVDTFTDSCESIRNSIDELLNNDVDLRRLEICRFWENSNEWDNPEISSISEDVENLLEYYEQEIESMLGHIHRINESLDNTIKLIQLHLASIRNTFLKSELSLDIITTVVTFIGALASIFGMNIPNGYEHNKSLFWPMSNAMIATCIMTAASTFLLFRKMKL